MEYSYVMLIEKPIDQFSSTISLGEGIIRQS